MLLMHRQCWSARSRDPLRLSDLTCRWTRDLRLEISSRMRSRVVQSRFAVMGTAMRSYLYASDLAVWLWTVLVKAPSLVPVNIGSAAAISIRELANEVAEVLTPGLPVRVAGVAQPGVPRAQYVPDVTKAETLLGLRQTVSLRDAIERTASWHGWKHGNIYSQLRGAIS